MQRVISYVLVFVCGFAACAVIAQRMWMIRGAGAAAAVPLAVSGAAGGNAGETAVADAAARVAPAVVNIDFTETRLAARGPLGILSGADPETVQGSGSGIIVSSDGYVVTNNHVVDPAMDMPAGKAHLSVRLYNGREYRNVTVVGRDTMSDLAVLKIDQAHDLPAATLGDSDRLRVGDWAIAVGNPLGFNSTVTLGIVSALNRSGFQVENDELDHVIQTDAAINPGSSGGALADISGDVIGINTAIASSTGASVGIGFAIPINSAKRIIQQLIATGRVVRPYLGVAFSSVGGVDPASLPAGVTLPTDGVGALIVNRDGNGSAVASGSPAAKAGLKDFDVIRAVDGKPVDDVDNVKEWVQDHGVGDVVNLQIWRSGRMLDVPVTLETMPDSYASLGRPAGAAPTGDVVAPPPADVP